MVRREIEERGLSDALTDLIHAHECLERFVEASEVGHESALRKLRDRGEADFREGRIAAWKDVKARNICEGS